MRWLRWMIHNRPETDEDRRQRLLRDLDNNWIHYTGPRGVPEDAWAVEKCIALLRGRKSRWW
jgi:hypothetical protein